MYCPQCGQQQVSSDMRFCSRCGFPLGGVMQLLSNGGLIPQSQSLEPGETQKVSPRRKGVQQGVMLIFLGILLTSLLGVLNAYLGVPEVFPAITAIIGFMGGPARILYALMFEEGAKKIYTPTHLQQPNMPAYQQPQMVGGAAAHHRPALPPQQQNVPLPGWRRPDTAELVRPPSVTEHTTKLLDKQDDAS